MKRDRASGNGSGSQDNRQCENHKIIGKLKSVFMSNLQSSNDSIDTQWGAVTFIIDSD